MKKYWDKNIFNNKLLLPAIVLVIAALFGSGFWLYQKSSTLEFKSENITFKYPKEYEEQEKPAPALNQSDTLIRLGIQEPASSIELAIEKSANRGALVTKMNTLDFLEGNADKSLPVRYTGFKKIKSERISISGYDATIISFSYIGQDEKTTIYLDFYIMPYGDDAYYLTVQSADKNRLEHDTNLVRPTLAFN